VRPAGAARATGSLTVSTRTRDGGVTAAAAARPLAPAVRVHWANRRAGVAAAGAACQWARQRQHSLAPLSLHSVRVTPASPGPHSPTVTATPHTHAGPAATQPAGALTGSLSLRLSRPARGPAAARRDAGSDSCTVQPSQ
jgi:hypothetical protein